MGIGFNEKFKVINEFTILQFSGIKLRLREERKGDHTEGAMPTTGGLDVFSVAWF